MYISYLRCLLHIRNIYSHFVVPMLSPIFLPFLSHKTCSIASQRQIFYISFSWFLSFFAFSPTLLSQPFTIFFTFLLPIEAAFITAKYLPYLSHIILSFLFRSYFSSDENRKFTLRNFLFYKSKLQFALIAGNTTLRPKKCFRISIVGSCEFQTGEQNLLYRIRYTHKLVSEDAGNFHYGHKERNQSSFRYSLACVRHAAACKPYNVRACIVAYLKQNKNAILRNGRQYAEEVINMYFKHRLRCLLIHSVLLANIIMMRRNNINNVRSAKEGRLSSLYGRCFLTKTSDEPVRIFPFNFLTTIP